MVYTVVNNKSLPTYCVMQERVCFFPRDKKKMFFWKKRIPFSRYRKMDWCFLKTRDQPKTAKGYWKITVVISFVCCCCTVHNDPVIKILFKNKKTKLFKNTFNFCKKIEINSQLLNFMPLQIFKSAKWIRNQASNCWNKKNLRDHP